MRARHHTICCTPIGRSVITVRFWILDFDPNTSAALCSALSLSVQFLNYSSVSLLSALMREFEFIVADHTSEQGRPEYTKAVRSSIVRARRRTERENKISRSGRTSGGAITRKSGPARPLCQSQLCIAKGSTPNPDDFLLDELQSLHIERLIVADTQLATEQHELLLLCTIPFGSLQCL